MDINAAGLTLIKQWEACKLVAYRDIRGIWTIGYGDTEGVYPGLQITQDEANTRLSTRVEEMCLGASKLITFPVTSNQFSAVISLAYNCGEPAIEQSTMWRLWAAGDIAGAADEFPKWDHAAGAVLPGLLARRQAERALFLTA